MQIEEAVKKFNTELPDEIRFSCSAPEVMKPLRSLEAAYNINLAPLIIYFAIGELKFGDISEYIENEYQLDKNKVRTISKEIEEEILKPLVDRINFLNAYPEKDMSMAQEKNIAEQMFQQHLRVELLRPSIITQAINFRLFAMLSNELDFQQVLVRAIYENNEKITKNMIVVNEQSVEPTINNWLKDYISKYGTNSFDSITQSAFLINSENGKKLDDKERALLARVLKTYINIKFFPDSMPTDDGAGWEIIPVEEDETAEVVDRHQEKSEEINGHTSASLNISDAEISTKATIPEPVTIPMEPSIIPKENSSLTQNKKNTPSIPPPPPAMKRPVVVPPPVRSKTNEYIPEDKKSTPFQDMSQSVDSAQSNKEPLDELLNLKNMLLQYPPDSLERQAIEEEIKKIETT